MESKDGSEKKSALKPKLPYPQRFKKKTYDKFSMFLDIFEKLHINIPFTDTLQKMPKYAKFLKEVMSRKRKLEDFEMVNLTEECSAILQKKIPQQLKDLGSFMILGTIGYSNFNKELYDLGANINLIPLSIFRILGFGEVKPMPIALQLEDRSLTYPRGIIGDVLVKIDKFIFPANFVVIDMEEDEDMSLILGRPFFATAEANIDVKKGDFSMGVEG
ncbi:uncharacterized protein [Henckelia pumila]|uniref:uncharacterized protein n=1 Tax=Henckelia pumila TaxID=405737 RepID=UPI003C6DBFA4